MGEQAKGIWRSTLPHLVAIVLFLVLSYGYFAPLLGGKEVAQHDRDQWQGTAKELIDYQEAHGEQSHWTNRLFGGMPSVLVSLSYPWNVVSVIDDILLLGKRPASYIFLTMLGFYFLLLVVGVNPWLAIAGSVAYGFSTYYFIIVGAGHNAKSHALCYVAPMVASLIMTYRGRLLGGGLLFALFFALSLVVGHLQITYYSAFILAALAIGYFVEALREKRLGRFGKATGVLVLAAIVAIGANFNRLYQTWDYGRESIRGGAILKESGEKNTGGLDHSYATAWSYGRWETLNMFIPNLMGGSSSLAVDADSHVGEFLHSAGVPPQQAKGMLEHLPMYWGPQPMTSGPVYVGAGIVFLFVLGLFVLRGAKKWALLGVSILAILLAWGHNLQWFTDLAFRIIPGYDRFRTVSMILVICELTIPLIGFWGLSELLAGRGPRMGAKRVVLWSGGITLGLALLVWLVGAVAASFVAPADGQYLQAGFPQAFIDALRADRAALLRSDALRSALFVILTSGALLLHLSGKLKLKPLALVLTALFLVDLWPVNTRYDGVQWVAQEVNETPFPMTPADRAILQDTAFYRVCNTTVSTFNDASTSYYHNSIGGYHGAKLRRFQDVVDRYAQTPLFLDLFNVRYVIVAGPDGTPVVQRNGGAYGNCWFVDSVRGVRTPDEEIALLGETNLRAVALQLDGAPRAYPVSDTLGAARSIVLTEHAANRMVYRAQAPEGGYAVFSEIYYPRGWEARIDGVVTPIDRVDYLLRGMEIPAGEHAITFTFALPMYGVGQWIDLCFGLLIVVGLVVWGVLAVMRQMRGGVMKAQEGGQA